MYWFEARCRSANNIIYILRKSKSTNSRMAPRMVNYIHIIWCVVHIRLSHELIFSATAIFIILYTFESSEKTLLNSKILLLLIIEEQLSFADNSFYLDTFKDNRRDKCHNSGYLLSTNWCCIRTPSCANVFWWIH